MPALKEMSVAEQVAQMTELEREEILADLDTEMLLTDPYFWLRPSQLLPISRGDSWSLGAVIAGRGFGKTRVLSEFARHKVKQLPAGSRGALVARTAADVRDVLVNGQSGILSMSPPDERPHFEPSKRLLTWPNGSTALLFTSEAPDQLRGPQFDWAIADELASWYFLPDESGLTAWDNLQLATRLGDVPQILAATTPRRTPFMKKLLEKKSDERTLIITGSTFDNALNLSPIYLDTILGLYGGTRLAKQELEGILLEDIEGALFPQDLFDSTRLLDIPEHEFRIVAVDPSVAERPRDECGIVVVAGTAERELHRRHVYILDDCSLLGSPGVWAQRVVDTAHKWSCNTVVAEGNQGGELVAGAVRSLDPNLRVVTVHARVNKTTRAEPVALMFEQGRAHIIGWQAELETQMASWDPTDKSHRSPDRMDACVWGVTALAIKPASGMLGGTLRSSAAVLRRRFPTGRLPNPRSAVSGPAGATATGGYARTVLRTGGRRSL